MKYFKTIALASLLTLAFGCKAVKVDNPTTENQDNVAVSFNARQAVVTEISKADPAALPSGAKANVSVYATGDVYDASTNKVLAKAYTSAANGAMTTTGDAMIIPMGSYDFLSVGATAPSAAPAMSATQVSGMISGVDYIAAKETKTIAAGDNGRVVNLAYKHLSSLVKITVVPDPASVAEVTELTKLTITPSVGPWSISVDKLADPNTAGQVASVESKATQSEMSVATGTVIASYPMLPVATGNILYFTITAQIKTIGSDAAISATYEGQIALPAAGYVGGKVYSYSAKVASGAVTFSNATISDWGEGDTGIADELPTEETAGA